MISYADRTGHQVAEEDMLRQHALWDKIGKADYRRSPEPVFTDQDLYVIDVLQNVDIQQPIAYNMSGASAAVGFSKATLKSVIKKGDLPVHYVNSRAVLLYDDLRNWAHSLPIYPQKRY